MTNPPPVMKGKRGAPRTRALPEYFDPPEPWETFTVRLWRGGRRKLTAVDHLSDAEIKWVARVLTADLERRRRGRK